MLMSELLRGYCMRVCCFLVFVLALCVVWCFFSMEEGIRTLMFTHLLRFRHFIRDWIKYRKTPCLLAICKGHIHIAQMFRSDSKRSWTKKTHHTSHTSERLFIHAYELVGSISPTHDHQPFLFLLQPCNYKGIVGLPCLLFCFSM